MINKKKPFKKGQDSLLKRPALVILTIDSVDYQVNVTLLNPACLYLQHGKQDPERDKKKIMGIRLEGGYSALTHGYPQQVS